MDPAVINALKLSWHHERLGIRNLWGADLTGDGIVVAVLDTGLALPHGVDTNTFECLDAAGNAISPADPNGHGTCCASVIAGYLSGALGLAPDAKIVSYRVLETGSSADDIETAMNHILRNRPDIDIVSCSFVMERVTPGVKEAVRALTTSGRVVIAAAGDSDSQDDAFPEQTPNAVTVAAVDGGDQPLPHARTGSWIDLSAPGFQIPAVAPGVDNIVLFSESSAATAVLSGVTALVLSAVKARETRRKVARGLEGAFKSTAQAIAGADPSAVGAGVVDPSHLLRNILTQN